jgi:hypothetical protein
VGNRGSDRHPCRLRRRHRPVRPPRIRRPVSPARRPSQELQQAAAGRERDAAERHRALALQVYLRREYVSPMYDLNPAQIARPRAQHKPAAGLRPAIRVAPRRQALLHVRRAHHVADAVRHARRGRTWRRRRPADKAAWQVDVSASFRDRAGTWWRTWPDGLLKEISEPAGLTDAPPAGAT